MSSRCGMCGGFSTADGLASRPAPIDVFLWERARDRVYLDKNRIPSSNPRNVSGYIWSSIRSRTRLVEAV